ncbi:hypothetical protein P8452_70670 [Trifolium repens]|nr:hypothetical protein P8452_70670 [Trifolium repens]
MEEQQVPEGGEESEKKKPKLDVGNSDNTSYDNETGEKTDNHKIDNLHAQAGNKANDDKGDVDSPKTTKETADELTIVKQFCKTNVPTSDLGEKKVEEKSIDKLIEDELVDKSKKRFAKHESRCNGVVFVQMRKKDGDKSPKDIVTWIVTSATSTRKHMSSPELMSACFTWPPKQLVTVLGKSCSRTRCKHHIRVRTSAIKGDIVISSFLVAAKIRRNRAAAR